MKTLKKLKTMKQQAGRILKRCPAILFLIIQLIFIPGALYGQEKAVTLHLKDAALEDVLREIRNQTGLDYIFNHEEIPRGTRITIDITNAPVQEALDQCFKNIKLSYKITGNVIIITPEDDVKPSVMYQVVRGKVVDAESQRPLAFASVVILTAEPGTGTMTDNEGNFRIDQVPIGRHNLQVSYVGYETQIIPELMFTTGKEVILNIKLKEQISELKEVKVKALTNKDKPMNSMSTVSARTFSVEEARRYAGGFDDPGRLVTSFAGVTTENIRDNTIIIRGNSPKGLLWRLEGVEIPNPNHFANLGSFGGGGISALSALVMGNSDFFTGAFPAEYGNAMSGVFDIKLRAGNNENFEHAVQIGTLGIDISSEGPINKQTGASYLFNYRYSTLGLVKHIFPEDLKNFVPVYQDLCFKINVPTKKAGIFSLWGMSLADIQSFPAVDDTSEWKSSMDRMNNHTIQKTGALGLNHRYIFRKQSWSNISFSISGDLMDYEDDIFDYDLTRYDHNDVYVSNYKYTFSAVFNHKFSARHANRTGIIADKMHYDLDLKFAPSLGQDLMDITKEKGSSDLVHVFSQSKISITKSFLINAGIHGMYFNLNNEFIIEPRVGLVYNLGQSQLLSFAYGKHSRIEPLTLYFVTTSDNFQPNTDLRVSKAHHFVMAYDISINSNLRFKVEPYVQFLYDVPVIPDSNYSVLNLETEWYYFKSELINTGTGRNVGFDLTLERFLDNGYYYLVTASVFDSKYKGDDGREEHSTRFDKGLVINLLYGKEWTFGAQKNKMLGVSVKMQYTGGRRITPINQEQSIAAKDVVYDYSRIYEDQEKGKLYVNATINYRFNKRKYSGICSLQMINVLFTEETYGYLYNYKSQLVEPWNLVVPVPGLSYKIEF